MLRRQLAVAVFPALTLAGCNLVLGLGALHDRSDGGDDAATDAATVDKADRDLPDAPDARSDAAPVCTALADCGVRDVSDSSVKDGDASSEGLPDADAAADGEDAPKPDQGAPPATDAAVEGGADADASSPHDAAVVVDACAQDAVVCDGAAAAICQADGAWSSPQVSGGYCGASCTPGALRCTDQTQVGQLCGALGTWISNGSTDTCNCYVPGRFTMPSPGLALDSTTGLTWDSAMRAPATWTAASAACNAAGMRLPTQNELLGVMLVPGFGSISTVCPARVVPFDQAAMPTTSMDIGPGQLWTGEIEAGFGSPNNPAVHVVVLLSDQNGNYAALPTDDDTGGTNPVTHPYRCVK